MKDHNFSVSTKFSAVFGNHVTSYDIYLNFFVVFFLNNVVVEIVKSNLLILCDDTTRENCYFISIEMTAIIVMTSIV